MATKTKIISLNLVKSHLVVNHDDDDELIIHYENAAVSAFNTTTNRTLIKQDEALPEAIGNVIQADDEIIQGLLLLIGHWYANRETVSSGGVVKLPYAVDYLWMPHRWVNL